MNVFQIIKLDNQLNQISNLLKEKTPMTPSRLTQIVTLIISAAGTLGVPALAQTWLQSHVWWYTGFVLAAIVLHAIFPSIFSAPVSSSGKLPILLFVIGFFAFSSAQPVHAQVTAAATASAFRYQGSWTVGTEETESLPIVYWGTNSANVFSIGAREILNPGAFSIYGALGNYQPDISSLLKHTTLTSDQVSVSFDLAGGVATLASGSTQPAVEGRVNLQVDLTPNTSFTGGYAGGGLVGGNKFGVVSAGFAYVFGGPTDSAKIRNGVKRHFVQRYQQAHFDRQFAH